MENPIILQNKPLVEAIFEIRWKLKEVAPNVEIDPYIDLLVGRLYDRLRDQYPEYEALPTSRMPQEICRYIIQHRYRKAQGGWPLIQLGPGILTVNETEGYLWDLFKNQIFQAISTLNELYPQTNGNFAIKRLQLRYIDAIEFDFNKSNILTFLNDKLKVNFEFQQKLFNETIQPIPTSIDFNIGFPTTNPNGELKCRFIRGKKNQRDALIWETIIESTEQAVPSNLMAVKNWVVEAHNITHSWFLKMIEGDLRRRFE